MNMRTKRSRQPSAVSRQQSSIRPAFPPAIYHLPTTTRSGFTLLEMLVAVAILALLMVAIFSAYDQVAKVWTLGEKRTEAFQSARLVLNQMGAELESAIATTNNLPSPNGKSIRFINNSGTSDSLYWVYSASDSMSQSYTDLTECGYQVALGTGSLGMKAGYYYLVYHQVHSDGSGYDIFRTGAPSGFTNGQDAPILDNALCLKFRFEYADTSSSTNITSDVWPPSPAMGNSAATLPRAVYIRLAVTGRRTGALIVALGGLGGNQANIIPNAGGDLSNITGTLGDTLRENVHIFYKTVYLRNATY